MIYILSGHFLGDVSENCVLIDWIGSIMSARHGQVDAVGVLPLQSVLVWGAEILALIPWVADFSMLLVLTSLFLKQVTW